MVQTRSSNRKVLVLAGDGIGPEIMRQALRVIEFFDQRHIASFDITEGLVGGAALDESGVPLTDAVARQHQHLAVGRAGLGHGSGLGPDHANCQGRASRTFSS